MAEAIWQLTLNEGETRTLQGWGISGITRSLVSQGVDTVSFRADGKSFDSNEDFIRGSQIRITKDGLTWFSGVVTSVPRQASSSSESLAYKVSGPWYWLDQITYKLVWGFRNGNTVVSTPLPSSHVVLNFSGGLIINTGQQITQAIAYAISRGAPIQIGTVTPHLFPPLDESRDITCGGVIRKMLRWSPSAVTWFDYTTAPYPTFHCKEASELDSVTLGLLSENRGSASRAVIPIPTSHEINALYENQRPSVCINYERKNSLNGQDYISLIQDIAPTGATGNEIGGMVCTVDLMGTKATSVSASLECQPVPDAGTSGERLDWLKAHLEELQDTNIQGLALTSWDRREGSQVYPRELVNGQLADWMNFSGEDDVIFAKCTYSIVENGTLIWSGEKRFKAKFKATDAVTGDYRTTFIEDLGDPVPTGVAQYIYDQVKDLQFGGTFVLEEEELRAPPALSIGQVASVFGGRQEWLTMRGLVQQVSEELDNGRTTVAFGPPEHLGVSDLMELTRVNRDRKRQTPTDALSSGKMGSGSQLKLGEKMPNNVTGANDPSLTFRAVKSGTKLITLDGGGGALSIVDTGAAAAKGVIMSLAACFGGGKDRQLTIQEIPVCEQQLDGTTKMRKMLTLRSEVYD